MHAFHDKKTMSFLHHGGLEAWIIGQEQAFFLMREWMSEYG